MPKITKLFLVEVRDIMNVMEVVYATIEMGQKDVELLRKIYAGPNNSDGWNCSVSNITMELGDVRWFKMFPFEIYNEKKVGALADDVVEDVESGMVVEVPEALCVSKRRGRNYETVANLTRSGHLFWAARCTHNGKAAAIETNVVHVSAILKAFQERTNEVPS